MRQGQKEKRLRDLWRALPEKHREGVIDVLLFKEDVIRNRPDLLDGVEGDLKYFQKVLSGLYKSQEAQQPNMTHY